MDQVREQSSDERAYHLVLKRNRVIELQPFAAITLDDGSAIVPVAPVRPGSVTESNRIKDERRCEVDLGVARRGRRLLEHGGPCTARSAQ
ncbi:hypothetical protein OG948_40325 (plasmid) [Embleya sp. NBC_00888]|uniref:hypothetical protein n=1 Tax=Embleya sp. NBC_00888 TaxID=2975960 RepID=UPI00386B5F68|nr:hypothetical protein OG948_40325 [Embleya sp. NBC_00888]